jgi:tRNA(fMet)-specific endonuclease VapC
MRYLLDTDICIYLIKHQPRKTLERFREHSPEDVGISTITLFELQYGVAKSNARTRAANALAKFLSPLNLVEFDRFAASEAAEIRARLEASGAPIGPYDLLIAGVALSRQLYLVTNNIKEFQKVDGLKVENWTQG